MPNYYYNTMTIKKVDAKKYVLGKDEDGVAIVDFNVVVPMPDSIKNTVYGTQNGIDIYWFLSNKGEKSIDDIIKDNYPIIRHAGSIFVTKETLEDAKNRYIDVDPGEYATDSNYLSGQRLIHNYLKYGAFTWYDWSCKYWGTKWNAFNTEVDELDEETYTIMFQTAWYAPVEWLKVLATKCDFNLSGMDEFAEYETFGDRYSGINGKFVIEKVGGVHHV